MFDVFGERLAVGDRLNAGSSRKATLAPARTSVPVARLKTEEDPPDWRPIRSAVQGPAAIKHVEKTVPLEAREGIVLRYGGFYGPGASNVLCRTRSLA